MKIINVIVLFVYTLVFVLVGVFLISFAFNAYQLSAITGLIETAYANPHIKTTLSLSGALMIFISILILQLTVGKLQRERTIAFENPDGQVLISLSAIEDFIKRTMKQLPEIKELRPNVIASKKGVNITSRVTLFSDAHIPDVTEKIQNILKNKVQGLLGIEEPVNIRVHIVKIVNKESVPQKEIIKREEKPIPFHGIDYGSD